MRQLNHWQKSVLLSASPVLILPPSQAWSISCPISSLFHPLLPCSTWRTTNLITHWHSFNKPSPKIGAVSRQLSRAVGTYGIECIPWDFLELELQFTSTYYCSSWVSLKKKDSGICSNSQAVPNASFLMYLRCCEVSAPWYIRTWLVILLSSSLPPFVYLRRQEDCMKAA